MAFGFRGAYNNGERSRPTYDKLNKKVFRGAYFFLGEHFDWKQSFRKQWKRLREFLTKLLTTKRVCFGFKKVWQFRQKRRSRTKRHFVCIFGHFKIANLVTLINLISQSQTNRTLGTNTTVTQQKRSPVFLRHRTKKFAGSVFWGLSWKAFNLGGDLWLFMLV